ncbi:MAG: cysteine-rich KTR domain-containing protein [Eubacteriales bacterium]|nr:cysteine-rich KTR domain-containing protein [Eubacteriales bacterium]
MISEQNLKWVLCPFCKGKTRTKLLPDTVLKNYPLFCPKCKKTIIVNAVNQKIKIKYMEPDD